MCARPRMGTLFRVIAAAALAALVPATQALALYEPVATFGSPGSDRGQFQTPTGIAVDLD